MDFYELLLQKGKEEEIIKNVITGIITNANNFNVKNINVSPKII